MTNVVENTVIIREATILDIYNLEKLNKECLPIAYSKLQDLEFILSPYNLCLVAEEKGQLIGFLIGQYNTNNFHILSIGVKEKYRSRGIGKYMIDILVNNPKYSKHYNNITLHVHDLNDKGIKFYKKNNFVINKYYKNYYNGILDSKSQGAYLMKKNI